LIILFRFIYCGKIDLSKLQGPDILKLLIAIDELDIQSLILHVQECLVDHLVELLRQSSTEILEIVYQHENFTILYDRTLKEICEEPEILFNSNNYINLEASLLELVLKRDLLLDEITIWDNLIKWCLAQHPNISQNATQWSKEEIAIMKKTIDRFIPLIKFCHISSKDFIIKVHPFKEIMPKDLIDNMLPKHPECVCDSILITPQHFAIFANWIKKQNDSYYNERNIPYYFNLLYRASRDGDTTSFHNKCDNKGATIVVIKIKDQLMGGYNPLRWDSSDTYHSTNDSFIFFFANRNKLRSAKVGYSKGDNYSIQCGSCHGPIFGYEDLFLYGTKWTNTPYSYPTINGMPTGTFMMDDYEVFQVIKK